ncbi:MAG TPA: TOBE domain-containing protein [Actinokineospora sp.]|nr:TOBE domain-containing protein [Actinokineospora sp.]
MAWSSHRRSATASASNRLTCSAAVVDVPIYLGAITRVHVHCGGERIAVDLPSRDAADLVPGAELTLAVPASAVRLYPV